ncbi:CfaE/CblD family pilus tip adhesin [Shigella flexneri]
MAALPDSNRSSCTEDGQHYYIYDTKFLTLYLEQTEMKKLPIGGLWEGKLNSILATRQQIIRLILSLMRSTGTISTCSSRSSPDATPLRRTETWHSTGSVNGNNYGARFDHVGHVLVRWF